MTNVRIKSGIRIIKFIWRLKPPREQSDSHQITNLANLANLAIFLPTNFDKISLFLPRLTLLSTLLLFPYGFAVPAGPKGTSYRGFQCHTEHPIRIQLYPNQIHPNPTSNPSPGLPNHFSPSSSASRSAIVKPKPCTLP